MPLTTPVTRSPVQRTGIARSLPWRWIALGAILLGVVVAGRLLPLDPWLKEFNHWIAGMGTLGLFIFALVYAAAAVLFVPGSVLTLGAGFVFGILWGTAAVSLGSTLGAGLSFLIARYVARDRVLLLAKKSAKFAAIDGSIGREGWKIVLLLRLSPLIPFNASNYLYGLTVVRFWPYILASWLGMLPGTLLYVYLGAAGRTGLLAVAGREASHGLLQAIFIGAGLVATVVATWHISRMARRALGETKISE